MIRYIVIYTFLLAFGKGGDKITTQQYGRVFTDRDRAYSYYQETTDDCFCDTAEWQFITRTEMREGAIILVEFDSIVK